MVHIPQKFMHGGRILEEDPTRVEDNHCVIIRQLSAKKPVWHNQEINSPPCNCQVRPIGCIYVLPDAPSEQPNSRVLISNILTLIDTPKGLQNAGSNNKTSEIYTRKSIPSHIQADKHTSEHSHQPTDSRRIFFGMRSCN